MPAPSIPHSSLPVAYSSANGLTRSETEDEDEQLFNWRMLLNWRAIFQKKNIVKIVVLILVLAISIVMIVERNPIVQALQPYGEKLKAIPAGWLIPIAIFFVISFPPLFGHEIITLLVGVIWGFGIGFAIAAAGTLLGEIGNFFAFKYLCAARAEKLQGKSIRYACLTAVIREGGFLVAVISRFSVIPTHLLTAIYATCGLEFWIFLVAAIIGLPKQMALVYLGVVLEGSATGTESSTDQHLSIIVTVITVAVTLVSAHWIRNRMEAVFPKVVQERRMKRLTSTQPASGHIPLQPFVSTAFPAVKNASPYSELTPLSTESGALQSRSTLYDPTV